MFATAACLSGQHPVASLTVQEACVALQALGQPVEPGSPEREEWAHWSEDSQPQPVSHEAGTMGRSFCTVPVFHPLSTN